MLAIAKNIVVTLMLAAVACMSGCMEVFTAGIDNAQEKRFDLAGTIVDDDGLPLDDVQMQYYFSTTRMRALGWESESVSRKKGEKTVSRTFHIKGSRSTRAGARFKKDGYYDESFSVKGKRKEISFLDMFQLIPLPGPKVRLDDLEIVMTKKKE